jgi:hypothetical protein
MPASRHPGTAPRRSISGGDFHAAGHLVAASVTLEVLTPPVVDHLYFWALQVAFPGAGPRTSASNGMTGIRASVP